MAEEIKYEEKISDREKAWAAAGHLSSLIGLILFIIAFIIISLDIIVQYGKVSDYDFRTLPIIIIPIIVNISIPFIFLNKSRSISLFVEQHCREAFNFQLSVTLYFIISIAAVFIAIGVILLFVLILFDISSIIDAFKKTRMGYDCHYPLTIRFIR
jgi:uncharacterized Tic20 family protein